LAGYLRNTGEGLVSPVRLLRRHASLVRVLMRREVVSRTSGTLFGALWMMLQPTLQILAFWFLLSYIFQIRGRGSIPFTDYLLTGMLCWLMMAEIMARSTGILEEFGAIYRRTLFPLALLPLLPLLASGTIYAAIFSLLVLFLEGAGSAAIGLGVVAMLMLWLLPVCYLLAVLGLFIRDIGKLVPFALSMIMYTTPILFTPEMVRDTGASWLLLSPFADLMAMVHAAVQGGSFAFENALRPVLLWLVILGPAWALFRRAEPHMREVL
jgi:lipopolysaccharide transport system permease protein